MTRVTSPACRCNFETNVRHKEHPPLHTSCHPPHPRCTPCNMPRPLRSWTLSVTPGESPHSGFKPAKPQIRLPAQINHSKFILCLHDSHISIWTSHLFIYLFLTHTHQYCSRLFLIRTVPHSTDVVHFHRKGNIQIIEYFQNSYYFIFCDNLIIIPRNKYIYTCMKILYVFVN